MPLPHRLSLEATYRVMFYSGSDIPKNENNPMSGEQSSFAENMKQFSDTMQYAAEVIDKVQPGVSAAYHTGKRLRQAYEEYKDEL